jgi:hypothetical protein
MRSSTFGAMAAMIALSACASPAVVVGDGQRRARERDGDVKSKPTPPAPVENLPGETNRQFAARMAALRAEPIHRRDGDEG